MAVTPKRIPSETISTDPDTVTPKKRMVRPRAGRKIAGVCLAVANYFNVDVTIVRIIWVIAALPGGIPGVLPYILCWILIPSE